MSSRRPLGTVVLCRRELAGRRPLGRLPSSARQNRARCSAWRGASFQPVLRPPSQSPIRAGRGHALDAANARRRCPPARPPPATLPPLACREMPPAPWPRPLHARRPSADMSAPAHRLRHVLPPPHAPASAPPPPTPARSCPRAPPAASRPPRSPDTATCAAFVPALAPASAWPRRRARLPPPYRLCPPLWVMVRAGVDTRRPLPPPCRIASAAAPLPVRRRGRGAVPSASARRTTARLANLGGLPARPAPSAPPHAHAGGLVRPAGGPRPGTFSPPLRGPCPCAASCPPLPPRAFPHVGAGGTAAGGVLRRLRQGAPYAGGTAARRRATGATAAPSTCTAGPLRAPCTAHASSPPAYRTMTRLADFDNLPARTVPRSSAAPVAHCATAILADLGMPRPHRPPPPVRRTAARPGRLGGPPASLLHSSAPSPPDHASRFASPAGSPRPLHRSRIPSCPASQAARPGGGLCRAGAVGACTSPRTAEPFRASAAAPAPAAPARRTATRTGDLGGPPPPCSVPRPPAACRTMARIRDIGRRPRPALPAPNLPALRGRIGCPCPRPPLRGAGTALAATGGGTSA